ncbi:hypothetical protein EDC01DRAFT_776479 [Geopyxis carbonaria]|nr:hypothetical protein EDC01DRAFT_776479 [Geopyxis carbonaria]
MPNIDAFGAHRPHPHIPHISRLFSVFTDYFGSHRLQPPTALAKRYDYGAQDVQGGPGEVDVGAMCCLCIVLFVMLPVALTLVAVTLYRIAGWRRREKGGVVLV